jgi:hypothetical protein
MQTEYDLSLLKLNETLIDYCHVKNRDCLACPINDALKLYEACPVDQTIGLLRRIKNNTEVIVNE